MTKEELQKAWQDVDKALRVITNAYYTKQLEALVNDAFTDAMRDIGVADEEIYR